MRAKLRRWWWKTVRRYAYEICHDCGRPVLPHTGSWWHAHDDLWLEVTGRTGGGVLCPPCFTERARAKGIWVHWTAVYGGRA